MQAFSHLHSAQLTSPLSTAEWEASGKPGTAVRCPQEGWSCSEPTAFGRVAPQGLRDIWAQTGLTLLVSVCCQRDSSSPTLLTCL